MNKDLVDVQIGLIMDSVRTASGILGEVDDITDRIINQTALEMSERFRNVPLRVRQELVVLIEQHQDDPDQMLIALAAFNARLDRICSSPWAKFSRMLKGDGRSMTGDDWLQGLYILLTLIIMLTLPLVIKFGLIPIFQEQSSTQQIQSK